MADGSPFDAEGSTRCVFPQRPAARLARTGRSRCTTTTSAFADNPIARYAISERDPLRFDSDGSLMLYIQRESPGRDKESNWLPTPKRGSFS